MNVISFLSVLAAVVYVQLGFYVIRRLDKGRGGLLFFLFTLFYALWSLGYSFMSSARTYETAWLMAHATAFAYTLSAPFFIHFALKFSLTVIGSGIRTLLILLYTVGALFMLKAMHSGLVLDGLRWVENGVFGPIWVEVSRMDAWAFAYTIYYNLCVIIGLLLLSIWAVTSAEVRAREQGRVLVLSFGLTLVLIAYNGFIEPTVPPVGIPRVPHLITVVFAAGVVLAIWKYDFLRRTPRTVLGAHSWHQLTRREREVTVLLLEGQSYKEIAAHLGISTNTVKTHVEHIYEKAGVSSRAQLSADLIPFSGPKRASLSSAKNI